MKHVLGLLGVAALSLSLLGCSNDCALDDDMRLFAGDAALDCGTADESHPRADVDACAAGAFEDGEAFIARYRQQGEDSRLVTAVAMNTDGKVKVFRWDSSPCGGGSCSPVTDVQACEGPSLEMSTSADENALPIACSSLGLAQRVCG
jgi:hypothetical protein